MPSFDESFSRIEAALAVYSGPSAPVSSRQDGPFESILAVVLARSVEPRKAARAIDALREAGLLDPRGLAQAEASEIVDALKVSGLSIPGRAMGSLRRLAKWVVDQHGGEVEPLLEESVPAAQLREELAELNGIGPATADAILLLALRRAVYPVDRATYRVLVRHGWLDPSADYDEARLLMERRYPEDFEALARLSGGMERLGREFCRVSVAKCERCPLRPVLPEGGPREPEAS